MCPISFNIYETKLNEVHFFSGTVIIHFLDKSYEQRNFKSRFINVLLCLIRKNTVRSAHVPFDFISLYLFVLTCNEIEKHQLEKPLKYLSILQPLKNDVMLKCLILFHLHCLGSL